MLGNWNNCLCNVFESEGKSERERSCVGEGEIVIIYINKS
jgi:hypothetical protein